MVEKGNELPYPQAGLGLVLTSEGLRKADGAEAGEMPRGCPACNREEGRSSASLTLKAELPLEHEASKTAGEGKVAVRVVIDYCPRCGRIYDVRCAATK